MCYIVGYYARNDYNREFFAFVFTLKSLMWTGTRTLIYRVTQ
jgi:hypothetical protein